MSSTFFMPSTNMMGEGCLSNAIENIKYYNHGLVVTDKTLIEVGLVDEVTKHLTGQEIKYTLFSGVQQNPTTENVAQGLALLKDNECDFVLSIGGGSPHDCAKAIALVATNGGNIADYEGVDKSEVPALPLIAVNTTAGTASEMTRFCVITDESRHIKMPIIDKHITPLLSVNDSKLMHLLPASLTAATGMDALTHAIEAYVSTAATPLTDAVALKSIELISLYLPRACKNGNDATAREQMAYAQFMAGMAFNNASVGYVHAMAHQLGGMYDLPHGICNAILLPHVQKFNSKACPERLKAIAASMGKNTVGMNPEHGALAAVQAIKELTEQIGIPTGLSKIGVQSEDIPELTKYALEDICGLTNPIQASFDDIASIFSEAM